MKKEAIIILAENRPYQQDADFRALYTLPNDLLSSEITEFFGNLLVVSDNTLAAQKSERLIVEEDQIILILPLVGALEIKHDVDYLLGVGEVGVFELNPVLQSQNMSIHNVYEDNLVNYLSISIKATNTNNGVFLNTFDLENNRNAFVEIAGLPSNGLPSNEKIYIGKFDGREDAILQLSTNAKALIYVISGAFEVENRLLEARTALALWNLDKIELEGLAQENILLVITL